MRKWLPTECDNGEKGKTVYQIVVPTVHRREPLEKWHMTCQCLVIWGYVKHITTFLLVWSKMGHSKVVQRVHTCQLGRYL